MKTSTEGQTAAPCKLDLIASRIDEETRRRVGPTTASASATRLTDHHGGLILRRGQGGFEPIQVIGYQSCPISGALGMQGRVGGYELWSKHGAFLSHAGSVYQDGGCKMDAWSSDLVCSSCKDSWYSGMLFVLLTSSEYRE